MARSRKPRRFEMSGVLSSVWACFCDSQLPTRMPVVFMLFTRLILRQFRREQAIIRGLGSQFADRRHSNDDGRGPKAAFFERYPPRAYGRLGRPAERTLPESRHELVQGHFVHPFCNGRGDAIEDERL